MKIGGDTTISSGKLVTYQATYELTEDGGFWNGQVLLREGKWHSLRGGRLVSVDRNTIGQAVIHALAAELETLNFEELNSGAD